MVSNTNSALLQQMLLFANFVGSLYPVAHCCVELFFGLHPEIMRMTALVERFDFVETRIADPAGQNEVTDKMRFPRRAAGETHARLKNNPRLLRDHVNRATSRDNARKLSKDAEDMRFTLREQGRQRKFPARMPHVFASEALAALRAFPKRRGFQIKRNRKSAIENLKFLIPIRSCSAVCSRCRKRLG